MFLRNRYSIDKNYKDIPFFLNFIFLLFIFYCLTNSILALFISLSSHENATYLCLN